MFAGVWFFIALMWAAMLAAPLLMLLLVLASGERCGRCNGETLLLRARWLRPLRRWVEYRWCFSCGTHALHRRFGPRPQMAPESRSGDPWAPSEEWRDSPPFSPEDRL